MAGCEGLRAFARDFVPSRCMYGGLVAVYGGWLPSGAGNIRMTFACDSLTPVRRHSPASFNARVLTGVRIRHMRHETLPCNLEVAVVGACIACGNLDQLSQVIARPHNDLHPGHAELVG